MTNSPIPGDVVARLRFQASGHFVEPEHSIMQQAADLIEMLQFDVGKYKSRLETVFAEKEALQRELAEARETNRSFNRRVQQAESDVANHRTVLADLKVTHGLSKDYLRLYDDWKKERTRATAAEAQASSARRLALEALEPFAKASELFSDRNSDKEPAGAWIHTNAWEKERIPRVGHLRAARSTYAAIRDIKGAGDAS